MDGKDVLATVTFNAGPLGGKNGVLTAVHLFEAEDE